MIYWEAFPKRFRVEVGGAMMADSRHARLLYEQGQLPRVYFPPEDVAWSCERPVEGAPPIGGFISFDLSQVGAWYEEDEKGYAHPRDPYHRVDVYRTTRRLVVRCGGTEVAEAERPAMLFETALPPRVYLSPDNVQAARFEKSETVSQCPYNKNKIVPDGKLNGPASCRNEAP